VAQVVIMGTTPFSSTSMDVYINSLTATSKAIPAPEGYSQK